MSRLNKHTAAATGRIKNLSLCRGKHLHHVTHNRRRREEFSSALTFCQCELAQEILINLTENIQFYIGGDIFKGF